MNESKAHTGIRLRRPVFRYAAAFGIVSIAAGLRFALYPLLGPGAPFLLFFASTIVAYRFGGRGPAAVAAVLGSLAARLWFMPPSPTGNVFWIAGYLVVSAVLIAGLDDQARQRQRAENAVAELSVHQDKLRRQSTLIELSPDAIISYNHSRVVTSWNNGAERLYGWTAAEAIGRDIHSLLMTRGALPMLRLDELIDTEGHWEGELLQKRRDGADVLVESRQALLKGQQGQGSHYLEINRDITDRKTAESALRESETRERVRAAESEAILEAVPAIVFVARDPDCRYITGSGSTYKLLGLPPGSNLSLTAVEGKPHYALRRNGVEIPPEGLPMEKAARTGEAVRNMEFDIVRADGECHSVLGDVVPMRDDHGAVHGVIGAFLDITERKHAEERLRETQKLESIGLLAGGIAHDFNNLMAGIMGYASLLQAEVSSRSREKVDVILNATERASQLTRQLLAYAGKGRFVVRPVDLTATVREISELLRVSIPKNVTLKLALEEDLPAVEADPGQMQQIIMNLVLNGAEAIPENEPGIVLIRTTMKEVTESDRILSHYTREPLPLGRYVCVEVEDTGVGMDSDVKARIFDPFFTTKFTGRGLGLSAVAGILKAHSGGVQLTSEPGRGSSFRIFLPASDSAAPATVKAEGPRRNEKGAGAILVVDDENIVLEVARAGLEGAGFQVLCARDGRTGLELFERNLDRIDLVLLDMTMPVMNGPEMFEALKRMRPSLEVILMSGYNEAESMRAFPANGPSLFIQKPFTVQSLIQQVVRGMKRNRRAAG